MSEERRFVIDGSMARGGGGFTYLVNIVPELSRQAPGDRFKVVCADERIADSLAAEDNVEIDYLGALGLKDRLRFTYSGAARLARDWDADVYFAAGEMTPPNVHCPTMASFRNPNVFTLGEGQGLGFKQRMRLLALNRMARFTASQVDRIMFVSQDSANWIGDSLDVPRHKRTVIHHGIDPAPWRAARKTSGVADRPYILSVSSVYPYKNYVRLIEAYVDLAERQADAPDLVIIGDDQDAATTEAMHRAKNAAGEHAEAIHLLGEVPYADIRSYYRNASLCVFPSYLETFGHPLIEAMAAEVPLVAADIPVFHEIAGDAAFYADPFSSRALATAMEEALFVQGASEMLVKRGSERLESFTWRRTAATLLSTFESLLGGDAQPQAVEASRERRAASQPSLKIAARVPATA